MAEAQFIPSMAPDQLGKDSIAAFQTGRSMMQRAQQFEQDQQLRQQQIIENQVLQPVHEATAKAAIVSAGSAIATATRQQQFRAQAALAAPQAQNEFLDATQLADWDAQQAELGRIQAKYAWLGNLPEYQGFLKTVDEARINAVARQHADQAIEAHQTAVETAAQASIERTGITAGSRENVAETQAGARVESADIAGKSRVDSATIRATAPKTYELETTMKLMQDAIDSGDTEGAAVYAARASKLNHIHVTQDEQAAGVKPVDTTVHPKAKPASAPVTPVQINVPNVTPVSAAPKLYIPPANPGEAPKLAPNVKTPEDVLHAYQQMVDDGVLTPEQARDNLIKLGFKKK